jgi:ABC-type nitrate/sulfonate/bicarbonate transport system permease component
MLSRIGRLAAPFLLMIGLWEIAGRWSGIRPALLPTPMEVGAALWDLTTSGVLMNDVAWSLRRTLLGLVFGSLLGLLLGTLTGRIAEYGWLFVPALNGLRALPPVAIVPLVVVWVGLGEPAKVFITSWAAFFPIWLNTHVGVASVDRMIIWSARSLGAGPMRMLFAVTFPAALPQVLVGFRLAISATLVCVVVAEMTGAYAGLGFRLYTSYLVFRVDRMLACMAVLAVLGMAGDRLFNVLTSRALPWISLTHDR